MCALPSKKATKKHIEQDQGSHSEEEEDVLWETDRPMHEWSHGRWKSIIDRMQGTRVVNEHWQQKYRNEASRYWDLFYKRHTTNFFKDRHYLENDFPILQKALTSPFTLVEFGCGVGNALFPCVARLPFLRVHAFDVSTRAIRLLNQHNIDEERINAFVYDPTADFDWPVTVSTDPCIRSRGGADVALMLFMLSAVEPSFHRKCFRRAKDILRTGGRVLFRDYGMFDEAELRFPEKQRLSEHFYARQDGTCAYFFSTEELQRLALENGLKIIHCDYICRVYYNRRTQSQLRRVWVHAEFEKDEGVTQTLLQKVHPESIKCLARSTDYKIVQADT